MAKLWARVVAAMVAVVICVGTVGGAWEAKANKPDEAAVVGEQSGPMPAKNFSHPDRVRYDGHCMTIDGRDLIIFSGAFHYFRCPKELWADRFAKIKAAHFNAVETYVAWNLAEPNEPKGLDDYSGMDLSDLRDWLKMAQEQFGLYTIVRPGPYICAEWEAGGYPRWLIAKHAGSGEWLRSDNPEYLSWCKHYMDAVCRVVAPEQITHKPVGQTGVILFQIENEYNYFHVNNETKTGQLRAMYKDAVDGGIDVPIFTCQTSLCRESHLPDLSQVFDATNLYPRHNLGSVVERLTTEERVQPDAPAMVSEMQGGWFSEIGGKLSEDQEGVEPAQTNSLTLTCLQQGVTIMNYYMLFGGTNFGGWGGRNITTTYDYDAPIRECGGVDAKYRVVQGIGEMLEQWGPGLARSEMARSKSSGPREISFAVRKGADNSLFVFCSRGFNSLPASGTATVTLGDGRALRVDYDLTRSLFQVARLEAGKLEVERDAWLPKIIEEPARPAVPGGFDLKDWVERVDDPGELQWTALAAGDSLLRHHMEEARYVEYRATPTLTVAQAQGCRELVLGLNVNDPGVVSVNGNLKEIARSTEREPSARAVVHIATQGMLKAGTNEITVLYDDQGQRNGNEGMGLDIGLSSGQLAWPGGAENLQWSLAEELAGYRGKWWDVDLKMDGWQAGKTEPAAALATWYRSTFELPARDSHVWVPWKATVDIAGDAYLFVNGHGVGRYWDEGPQRDFYMPECWLNFGAGSKNVLTVLIRPTEKGAKLNGVKISPYAQYAETR